VIICLYVDDLLIFGTNLEGIQETKKYLASQFKMKDMDDVDTILGIKVQKHSGVMLLLSPTTFIKYYISLSILRERGQTLLMILVLN